MKYNYFFDLDGVLIDEDNKIDDLVLAYFKEKQIKPIIATGRLIHDAQSISEQNKFNSPFNIGLNGAHIQDCVGNDILTVSIEKMIAKTILTTVVKNIPECRIEMNGFYNRYFFSPRPADFPREIKESHIIGDLFSYIDDIEVAGFLIIDANADSIIKKLTPLLEMYQDQINIVKTSGSSIEIFNNTVSKGNAISYLQNSGMLEHELSVAYGDSDNDMEMLEIVDISFAIRGKQHVEAVAGHVIKEISESFPILENSKPVIQKGDFIVSCQALDNEPLHSSYIMGRMAYATIMGGADGIRANSVGDILEIKKQVRCPIIGIIKKDYEDSDVYITSHISEIDQLVECGCDIIAIDATKRLRTCGVDLKDFVTSIKSKYPQQKLMADCSTFEEMFYADELGIDYIGTTLFGYTEYSPNSAFHDLESFAEVVGKIKNKVIAEGQIDSPAMAKQIKDCGVYAIVVGGAITRPQEIVEKFVSELR